MDGKGFASILDEFTMGQLWLNDVEVEVEGGPNELDPLMLLRAYEKKEDMDTQLSLAQAVVLNKHVVFSRKGTEVLSFVYTGGNFSNCFLKAPYLLNILLRYAIGVMLKKLTPPSDDSGNEERQ